MLASSRGRHEDLHARIADEGWRGDATSVIEFLRPLREQLDAPGVLEVCVNRPGELLVETVARLEGRAGARDDAGALPVAGDGGGDLSATSRSTRSGRCCRRRCPPASASSS